MKKLIVALILFSFLGVFSSYSAATVKSDHFQETMSEPSPLTPPEKITASATNLKQTTVYKTGLKRKARLEKINTKLTGSRLVSEKSGALSILSNIKNFISNRQKSMLARVTEKSKDRLDQLTSASAEDLTENYIAAESEKAKTVARADVKKTTDTTVAVIKTDTQVEILKTSLRATEKELKKKGLSRAVRDRLIKKINGLKNQITNQYTLLNKTKTSIANAHIQALKSAEDRLASDRRAADISHETNLKTAEAMVAEEAIAASSVVNSMVQSDMDTRQVLRMSLARKLTQLAGRVIALGSPEKPVLLRPKKQKVSKTKKVKIKKKALKRAQKVGKRKLQYYRKLFYSQS